MQNNTQQQHISVGPIIFQRSLYIQNENQINTSMQKIHSKVENSYLLISRHTNGYNTYESWTKILMFTIQINSPLVQFNMIPQSTQEINLKIFNQISHINFSNLIELNLRRNMINNIQFLSLLNCPQIQKLFLGQNKISRFNNFSKWSNKKLQKLFLYNNPIGSIQSLTKVNFMQKKLKDLTLQYAINRVISEDLNKLMKLQVYNIQVLQIRIGNRIYKDSNKNMLKKRFSEQMRAHLNIRLQLFA